MVNWQETGFEDKIKDTTADVKTLEIKLTYMPESKSDKYAEYLVRS